LVDWLKIDVDARVKRCVDNGLVHHAQLACLMIWSLDAASDEYMHLKFVKAI
jgi:hypothetical protein